MAIIIDFYGDSVVYGYDGGAGGGRVATPYPARMAQLLPQHTIRNKGVNTSSITDWVDGTALITNAGYAAWATEMAASVADVILIHSLDIFVLTTGQWSTALTTMVNVARAAGKKVGFVNCAPIPNGNVVAWNDAMATVATTLSVPVIDFYTYTGTVVASSGLTLAQLEPDGIHPNQSFYLLQGAYAAARFPVLFPEYTTQTTSTIEVIADRVKETTTSTGAGSLVLRGAAIGYRAFASVMSVGDTFHGAIVAINSKGAPTGDWETGYYTYGAGNTILRTRVDASSANNAAVAFGADTKEVFIDVISKQIEAVTTPMFGSRRVEYFGGNDIWGYNGTAGGGRVTVTQVQAFAAALPSTPPFEIANEAVLGMRADALLAGTDGLHPAWSYFMTVESTADIIILSLGIADLAAGRTQQEFRADLAQIITIAQDAGKFVILENTHRTMYDRTYYYAQAVYDESIAKGVPQIDQSTHWYDYQLANNLPLTALCPDGVNPSPEFHIMKGQYAAEVFRTLSLPAPAPL
jgi:lysophospholipase L1-like esterase